MSMQLQIIEIDSLDPFKGEATKRPIFVKTGG